VLKPVYSICLLDRWLYWLLHAHQYDAQTLGSLFSQPEFQKATDSIDRIAKKTRMVLLRAFAVMQLC
jgi:hypothetical protein